MHVMSKLMSFDNFLFCRMPVQPIGVCEHNNM